MSKQLKFDDEARAAILRGMAAVEQAVAATLGPRGQTVVLGRPVGPALVTKDGVTVAKTISLPDPWENEGAKLIQEVAGKTNTEAGDGTTAATILTHAIFREGMRQITAGGDPQSIERGIRHAVNLVVETLRSIATPIKQDDVDRLAAVATIAANGDKELGQVIARAIAKAGVEGNYSLDPSPTMETTLEIAEGLQFERGSVAPTFILPRGVAVLTPCNIFVTNRRMIDLKEMVAFLEMYMAKAKAPLLIIAEDVEGGALQLLAANHGHNDLKLCVVRAPGSGQAKKEELEDIAVLAGAKAYTTDKGDDPAKAQFEHLGSADRVIVTPHKTTIVGGHGSPLAIEARKDDLRSRIKDPETKEFVRAQLERRLAALSASIAVIKIGAGVNSKLLEKRDRAEDSLNATLAALREGIVPGGGTALVRCLPALEKHIGQVAGEERVGAQIIAKALTAPLMRIAKNAGVSGDVVLDRVYHHYADCALNPHLRRFGYNAATGEYEDLVTSGVIDPVKVVRLALQNSAELAGLLLTAAALVVDIPEKAAAPAMPQFVPPGVRA